MDDQNWQHLLQKYFDNAISKSELHRLLHKMDGREEYSGFKEALRQHWELSGGDSTNTIIDWDRKFDELFAEAQEQEKSMAEPKPRVQKILWVRWVAAASVLGLLVAGYLYFSAKRPAAVKQPQTVAIKANKGIPAPAKSNAVLTLANGQTITLDSVSNGSLAKQGNMEVDKLAEGAIAYKGSSKGELEYNILTVPRGSKLATILLSDGTKVWINSASSLKYPVAFVGDEREVEITGEAYFEVSPNPKMPFKVKKAGTTVTVLGTHFNVNAYEDESSVKVTLLEGSVKVDNGSHSKLLKPGQQAQVTSGIAVEDDVDVDEVMAWKNGKFQFGEAAEINAIMRQISRWYDVEIEFRGEVAGHIGGTISRDEDVSQVLKMLEMTGAVRFKTEGQKIIVMPRNF